MQDNIQVNFSLKGFTSILIGGYLFIAGYVIEALLNNATPLETLSPKTIENLIILIAFTFVLLSTLTLFFIGKKNAKKLNIQLWGDKTKAAVQKYIIVIVVAFIILIVLMNLEFTNYLTPTFLIFYGILLFLFKNKERKNLLVLSGLSLLLAILCFLIPTYWSSSLSILGIAHLTYGVVVKE
ncbi:hypothetical protein [Polaribacter sp. SA4-12]|uniref:hypothetical protein n=1 Tax=Polaribacter sp. SA4-12 TaxID=1312072 RepID=UPI000B3C5541|nr:hypothetical protein [Polaribacter sp. SA4-12]